MRIAFIEVKNFRKLHSVRIDFSTMSTLLVGANNSGKTSAMVALRAFLLKASDIQVRDFTISNWSAIQSLGQKWELPADQATAHAPTIDDWTSILPHVDVWIDAIVDELNYVRGMLPTLQWNGGLLGVRLRYEPEDPRDLIRAYLEARRHVIAASKAANETSSLLWPKDLFSFLEQRMSSLFVIRAYLLDSAKAVLPTDGIANPQPLDVLAAPMDGNPLTGLIRIHEISAQRGFGDADSSPAESENANRASGQTRNDGKRLASQLKSYYFKHLNPFDKPTGSDITALKAIEAAQGTFDAKLSECFSAAIKEVEGLGYPGVTDPVLKITTKIIPADGLNHDAAVQYEVAVTAAGERVPGLRLPENYNGLGYQNLISMLFRLMSYRDAWMRVGKADEVDASADDAAPIPPIHLVLLEEPEAHLHVQVQQVFVRKAYSVLTNHPLLMKDSTFTTQLLVSTHSNHVAHELPFHCLRYFRRLPSGKTHGAPVTAVENLSELFGGKADTQDFVARYLRAAHFEVFFADAIICVEGQAERLLLPHFIRKQFEFLDHRYLSLLDVGGSHAHRLRPLLEKLGIITLIITDLDAMDPTTKESTPPVLKAGQESRNVTLGTWIPALKSIDALMSCPESNKIQQSANGFAIRVAYQGAWSVKLTKDPKAVVLSNTFEDALVYTNIDLLKKLGDKNGIASKFGEAIKASSTAVELQAQVGAVIKKIRKAEFALDILTIDDLGSMVAPAYIAEGLAWLQEQVKARSVDSLIVPPISSGAANAKR